MLNDGINNKFSRPIVADDEAYYMSIPEVAAIHVTDRLQDFKSAADLCCAVGMLSVQLGQRMKRVVGVDIDPQRIEQARENARRYNVGEKVEFIVGDVLDAEVLKDLNVEVAVLDPDWSAAGTIKDQHVLTPE